MTVGVHVRHHYMNEFDICVRGGMPCKIVPAGVRVLARIRLQYDDYIAENRSRGLAIEI